MKFGSKFIVGIDEAGRSPFAGPVTVGAFKAVPRFRSWILKNIFENKLRDSKKLSPELREQIYVQFQNLKKQRRIDFCWAHISNKIIDRIGITRAVQRAIDKCMHVFFDDPSVTHVRLDGLLKAPDIFYNQKTIIKGDETDLFIACASIVAKVRRDRLMIRMSKKFPEYLLESHKGYGTKSHRQKILEFGMSPIHRETYCRKLITNFQND